MRPDPSYEDYIQLLKWLIIISLVFPIKVNAKQTQTPPTKTSDAVVALVPQTAYPLTPRPETHKTPPHASNSFRPGQYGGSCVFFAKAYTGHADESWGNGGRYLPLTHTAQIGSVVVFDYLHVAVVINKTDTTITIIESNYHLNGIIDIRTIDLADPTIKGYYMP